MAESPTKRSELPRSAETGRGCRSGRGERPIRRSSNTGSRPRRSALQVGCKALSRWATRSSHPGLSRCQPWALRGVSPWFLFLALRGVSPWRLALSALVFCFRLPGPALGFWSFPLYWAVIGRSVAGPSDDFGEVIPQFRPRLQLRFQASRRIPDTVGPGKAEPLGEVGQSRLRMAVAQPGCDRTRGVGILTACK